MRRNTTPRIRTKPPPWPSSDRRFLHEMALTQAEVQRRYRDRHRDDPEFQRRRLDEKRRHYAKRRAHILARNRRWALTNRLKVRAIWKTFYQRHIEAERQRSKTKDPAVKRQTQRKYVVSHRLIVAAKENRRRALKLGSMVGPVDYRAIVQAANGICAICHQRVLEGPAHIDHIIPLARGGSHTQDNLQFAHARCNIAKGARLPKVG